MNLFGLTTTSRFPFVVRAGQELPGYAKRERAASGEDLAGRAVHSDPMHDWWSVLPDQLQPKQVQMILRASLAGNIWQFSNLVRQMSDTWPTFRKASNELRTAVKMVKWRVTPHTEEDGKHPTKSAVAKANFVKRCIENFEPNPFRDEDGFKGMVYDLTDAVLVGVSITELLWSLKAPGPNGPEDRIRASAWVHPKHYSVNPDGGIGVADDGRGDMMKFNQTAQVVTLDNPSKFLVAKYKGKSGSALGAGEARCLAMCWVNIVFAVDWIRNFGQKYGNPFVAIPYAPGIAESERVKFEQAAKQCRAQGWMVYPRNSPDLKPDVYPAQNMTGDNPIRVMVDLAEKWCVQLLLGQTLTSDTSDGGKGGSSYALGQVHAGVKQEKLEAIADWIAEILQTQLGRRLIAENWGEKDQEVPHVKADFTHVESPMEAAQRMGVITSQCRLPVRAEEAYQVLGLTQPQPGEEVVVNGQIAKQDEPMNAEERFAQQLDQQVQQGEASMALQAEAQGGFGGGGGGQEEEEQVAAHHRKLHRAGLRDVLRAATAEQLGELEELVVKAQDAGGGNGEWKAVESAVNNIKAANRVDLFERSKDNA